MTTPNIRAALERLIELEDAKGPAPAIANAWTDAIAAARAALAEPVGEGPTTAELMSLSAACNSPSVFARAVLARWGTSATTGGQR
jgi:hypothetical protein